MQASNANDHDHVTNTNNNTKVPSLGEIVNCMSNDSITTFYFICIHDYVSIFKLLLRNILDESRKNKLDFNFNSLPLNNTENSEYNYFYSPLYVAAHNNWNSLKIVQYILSNDKLFTQLLKLDVGFDHRSINNSIKDGPSIYFCYDGNLKLTKLLLKHPTMTSKCINKRSVTQDRRYYDKTAFYLACQNFNIDIVELMINDERVNINLTRRHRKHPLVVLIDEGITIAEEDEDNSYDFSQFIDLIKLIATKDKQRIKFDIVLKHLNQVIDKKIYTCPEWVKMFAQLIKDK